ncbi:MAG: metallophosphoesterase [Hyphomicrobiaceae bacterium]|nr:metallophosphoesterase [Hyphomicrobiaceae bacterium]
MADHRTLTLAHLSDVHLPGIAGLSPEHWSAKRVLGFLNWQRGRYRMHTAAAIEAIARDVIAKHPDHIAVTGDIANLGLPAELAAAHQWLATLGTPEQVSVVPGNHDVYVPMRRDQSIARWAAYMTSSGLPERAPAQGQPTVFPYVRRLGGVALVGLNSAIPTPVFVAAGRLGGAQLAATADALHQLGSAGLVRVVLIHHPPLPGQAPHRRALADAADLAAVLRSAGAELVLHGHNHRNSLVWAAGPSGPIPVVGIASASASLDSHGAGHLARYNLLRIGGRAGAARIEVCGRGLGAPVPGGRVLDLESYVIADGCRLDATASD